jgi:integrase
MVEKLDKGAVDDADAPAKGNVIIYDTEVKGFGLRVTAAGAKSFILNYRNSSGRERRYTIGSYPDWTVSAARAEAKELRKRVDRGEDPLAERDHARGAPDMADLVERFIEEHLPTKRPGSQAEDRAMIRDYILPELKHLKVADVEFDDIVALHRKITKGGKPFRANRVAALLSKMFSIATRSGKGQWRTDNPCRGVKRNPEQGRERYLEPEEIERLMKVLVGFEDKESGNAIMLALLTGARRGEPLRATWKQFDLKKGVWTKPSHHTKQKKEHRVPLSQAALALLTNMHDAAPRGATYLFPSRVNDKGEASIRPAWEKIRDQAGIPDVRFHDLRHSFASMLVGSNLSLPIIGKLLGHTQASTTLRYSHLADDPLRQATDLVGKLVTNGNGLGK